jgi:uncharacterized repeat protein (TIGR01451 family)
MIVRSIREAVTKPFCALLLAFGLVRGFAQIGLPPIITVQPLDQPVLAGGTALFTVVATSLTSLTYQWYFNGVAINNATSASYTVANAACLNAGKYSVAVRNAGGTVNSTAATLTVLGGCITVDNITSTKTSGGGQSSLTWAHAVAGGADGLLIVNVSALNNTAVSSVTYGGIALTKIGFALNISGPGACTEMWQLKSPPVGSNNVVVTMNNNAPFTAGATSFFGVNQSSAFGTLRTAIGEKNTPSVAVNSGGGELVVDAVASHSAGSGAAGSGQTERWRQSTGTGGSDVWGSSSTKPGALSVTMSWTLSGSGAGEWAAVAVPLKPSAFTPTADIVTTIAGPTSAVAGSNVTYQIAVTNFGASTSTNVVVTHALSSNAVFVAASAGGNFLNGVVTWANLHPLASGARTNLSVTVKFPVGGQWTNIASSVAGTTDPSPSNNNGTAAAAKVVTVVYEPPTITEQPQSQTVCAGSAVALSVTVTGATPLKYQWFFQGNPLPRGTNATLAFANAPTAASGDYTVVVSNNVGFANSGVATLTVTNPPTILSLSDGLGMNADGFSFQISVPIGATYIIEASEDLQHWSQIYTNVASTSPVVFTDHDANARVLRFYRVGTVQNSTATPADTVSAAVSVSE